MPDARPEAGPSPRARRRGTRAELLAAAVLEAAGYVILDRNWHCRAGELDLVAREGEELVFIEVKARGAGASYPPEEAVGLRKQRRLVAAAEAYLAQSPWQGLCRFDVVAISTGADGPQCRIIRSAFTADQEM